MDFMMLREKKEKRFGEETVEELLDLMRDEKEHVRSGVRA